MENTNQEKFNLSPDTLGELQKNLFEWQNYNFGSGQDVELCILGICEEIGELCHAQLKLEQSIRGSKEKHEEDMKDAIGDICIYAFNYLSGIGISIEGDTELYKFIEDKGNIGNEFFSDSERSTVFDIYKVAAKIADGSNMQFRYLFLGLSHLSNLKGWKLEEIIRETWKTVGKRDWVKYPKNGMP